MAKNKRTTTIQAPAAPANEEAVMQEQEQEQVQETVTEQDAPEVIEETGEGESVSEAEAEGVAKEEATEEGVVEETATDEASEDAVEEPAQEAVAVEVVNDPSAIWTVPVKTLVAVLDDYEAAMAPGRPQTVTTGEVQQRALYRVLLGALSLEGSDFTMIMDEICRRFVAGATGVYSESHALRFFEHLVLDTLERQRFRLLVTTLQTLADPKSREVQLRFLDLATVARTLPDLGSQQRLLAYFRGA